MAQCRRFWAISCSVTLNCAVPVHGWAPRIIPVLHNARVRLAPGQSLVAGVGTPPVPDVLVSRLCTALRPFQERSLLSPMALGCSVQMNLDL